MTVSGSAVRQREGLADEMGWVCHYCRCELTVSTSTTDHVVPRALGGTSARLNLVLACCRCNSSLGAAHPKCSCDRCLEAHRHIAAHHSRPLRHLVAAS